LINNIRVLYLAYDREYNYLVRTKTMRKRPGSADLLRLCFFLFLLLAATILYAQTGSGRRLSLPKPFTRAPVQNVIVDNQGFLWFNTYQGVWRYDGTSVQALDVGSYGISLTTSHINIQYYDGLLIILNGLQFHAIDPLTKQTWHYTLPSEDANFTVDPRKRLYFFTRDGRSWIFTRKDGLVEQDNWLFNAVKNTTGGVEGFYLDNKTGQLSLFYGNAVGIVKRSSIEWKKTFIGAGADSLANIFLIHATDKAFLVKYNNGFVLYERPSLKPLEIYSGHAFSSIISEGDKFHLFRQFASRHTTVARSDHYVIEQPIGEEIIRVHSPVKSVEGQYMAGTDKGIFVWDKVKAGTRREDPNFNFSTFNGKSIRGIYRLPSGKLYVGTYEGFYASNDTGFHEVTSLLAYSIIQSDANHILVGMEGGTGFFEVDTRTDKVKVFPPDSVTIHSFCIAAAHSAFWAGERKRIYRVERNGEHWIRNLWLDHPAFGFVRDLKPVKDGFMLATENGIFHVDLKKNVNKLFPKENNLMIHAFVDVKDGRWLATHGQGLLLVDKDFNIRKRINANNGLAGLYVYSLKYFDDLLFAGTNGGLNILDADGNLLGPDLEDVNRNPLISQEFNHSSIFIDTVRHQLFMGGIEGVIQFDASAYRNKRLLNEPKLSLAYVKKGVSGTSELKPDLFAWAKENIIINPRDAYVGIKLGGRILEKQQTALFRLKERSEEWQPFNLSQELSFFALPPGEYTLEARYPTQSDPATWLSQKLIVRPAFYQTWLFKGLILLLIFAVAFYFWNARLAKIKREHQLRTAIASDLHDEIGSALTRISISSELLSMQHQTELPVLERISTDSKKAIASISDIIWSIDARNDNFEDLVLRMREHAANMLDSPAFDTVFVTSGLENIHLIPQVLRQNLYLIFKEAVNNIARHATGGKVQIELKNSSRSFSMTIINEMEKGSHRPSEHTGQGLRNMQMRAKRMNAHLETLATESGFELRMVMHHL
jgi:signal transduction histidine kinase/ligand-binding sensor domain-containing protein